MLKQEGSRGNGAVDIESVWEKMSGLIHTSRLLANVIYIVYYFKLKWHFFLNKDRKAISSTNCMILNIFFCLHKSYLDDCACSSIYHFYPLIIFNVFMTYLVPDTG